MEEECTICILKYLYVCMLGKQVSQLSRVVLGNTVYMSQPHSVPIPTTQCKTPTTQSKTPTTQSKTPTTQSKTPTTLHPQTHSLLACSQPVQVRHRQMAHTDPPLSCSGCFHGN